MIAVDDIKRLAIRYCDYPAVDQTILRRWCPPVGSAHEIGHLVISLSEDRAQPWYGFGEPEAIPDWKIEDDAKCHELAASIVHAWILVATDWWRSSFRNQRTLRASISPRRDVDAPEFFYDADAWAGAKRLLVERGLTRHDVQTAAALERTILRTLETT